MAGPAQHTQSGHAAETRAHSDPATSGGWHRGGGSTEFAIVQLLWYKKSDAAFLRESRRSRDFYRIEATGSMDALDRGTCFLRGRQWKAADAFRRCVHPSCAPPLHDNVARHCAGERPQLAGCSKYFQAQSSFAWSAGPRPGSHTFSEAYHSAFGALLRCAWRARSSARAHGCLGKARKAVADSSWKQSPRNHRYRGKPPQDQEVVW